MTFVRRLLMLLALPAACLAPAALAAQTSITGFVRDSLSAKPLAGATIQLVPSATPWAAGRTVISDSIGRYRIDSVPTGAYIIGFQHHASTHSAWTPSRARSMCRACASCAPIWRCRAAPRWRCHSAGIHRQRRCRHRPRLRRHHQFPRRRRLGHRALGPDATARRQRRAHMRQTSVKFGADGRFVVCNVPTGSAILLSARAGTGPAATSPGASSEIELAFAPGNPLVHRNLLIQMRESAETTVATTAAPADTAASTTGAVAPPARALARAGTARLVGRVSSADGKPVGGARVRLIDTEQVATTDSAGVFRLTALPAGTRALEVTAIGFQPVRHRCRPPSRP